jgi:hypothetical protein
MVSLLILKQMFNESDETVLSVGRKIHTGSIFRRGILSMAASVQPYGTDKILETESAKKVSKNYLKFPSK